MGKRLARQHQGHYGPLCSIATRHATAGFIGVRGPDQAHVRNDAARRQRARWVLWVGSVFTQENAVVRENVDRVVSISVRQRQ